MSALTDFIQFSRRHGIVFEWVEDQGDFLVRIKDPDGTEHTHTIWEIMGIQNPDGKVGYCRVTMSISPVDLAILDDYASANRANRSAIMTAFIRSLGTKAAADVLKTVKDKRRAACTATINRVNKERNEK